MLVVQKSDVDGQMSEEVEKVRQITCLVFSFSGKKNMRRDQGRTVTRDKTMITGQRGSVTVGTKYYLLARVSIDVTDRKRGVA